MKKKIGDEVRIKSNEWYIKNNIKGTIEHEDFDFVFSMQQYCGKYAKIVAISKMYNAYILDIDNNDNFWADWMFDNIKDKKYEN